MSNRPGLRALPPLIAVGLLLGLAEGVWHSIVAVPKPGYPGDGGASIPAHTLLGLSSILVPAWITVGLTWPFRAVWVGRLVWALALAPTVFAILDLVVHTRELPWFALDRGGLPHLLAMAPWVLLPTAIAAGVGSGLTERWMPSVGRTGLAVCVLIGLAAPLALWGLLAPRSVADPGPRDAPNVLFLTIDTLRDDAVTPDLTPHLSRWLDDGVRARGWSAASWTRPSFGAIFSGLGPTGNGGTESTRVYPGVDWWPERLRDAGYVTQAFVTNPNLLPRFGFERGFDRFDHSDEVEWLDPIIRSAWGFWLARRILHTTDPVRGDHVVDRAIQWLRGPAQDLRAPWFLWVHLMDPHRPYHLRGPGGALTHPDPPAWYDPIRPHVAADGAFHPLTEAREGRIATNADERRAVHELYRTEVSFADAAVGRLFDTLRELDPNQETLWVFTSDHGEEFWEHGGYEHGHALLDEVLRVPFAMGGAGLPAGWTRDVKLTDLGPTLLSVLQLPPLELLPRSGLVEGDEPLVESTLGVDRSDAFRNPHSVPPTCGPPALIAEGMLYGPPQTRWLAEDGQGYLRHDATGRLQARMDCVDRGWSTVDALPLDVAQRLRQLDLWRERNQTRAVPIDLDPQLLERLRAVGYME